MQKYVVHPSHMVPIEEVKPKHDDTIVVLFLDAAKLEGALFEIAQLGFGYGTKSKQIARKALGLTD